MHFMKTKLIFFLQAYNCLDESQTCVGILTTHNIRILSISILVFWSLYYFLWSSLYIRFYSKREQYTFMKLIAIIILLISLNWCLCKKITLKSLLIVNIGFLGGCNIILVLMEWFQVNVRKI